MQEQRTGSLLFGVGVNSDAGLTGSVVLNERNFDITRWPTSVDDLLSGRAFRGAGQELRIEAVPGTQLQRYTVSFREPFLFDSPYSLGVSGYYYDRIFNEYTEERIGARLLNRTTRSLSLTDTGTHFLESARRILAELDVAEKAAASDAGQPSGHLTLTAPVSTGSFSARQASCMPSMASVS